MRAVLLLVLLLAGPAFAEPELLREEAYNYRIVGKLPKGWKRRGARMAYVFQADSIPHAHVHFVRQRVDGELDVAKEVARRESHYRFPGVPKETQGAFGEVSWGGGGRKALLYEFKAKVSGVMCLRRVTVLFESSIWYELIETIYGDKTEELKHCRGGLEVFRTGFRLLVEPLPPGAATDAAERRIASDEYGYELVKPQGFLQKEVDTGADPGCRVQFERVEQDGRRHARVRLFEYAARDRVEPRKWFDVFFTGFGAHHNEARREEAEPLEVPGARLLLAERFHGVRDKLKVSTLVMLVHARSGRVFVLRIRTQADAAEAFAASLARISFRLRG